MPRGVDEEVGLWLAAMLHVQDRDLLGHTGAAMGAWGEYSLAQNPLPTYKY